MNAPKILVFAGSMRSGSYNKMLSKCAAGALRAAGAEVTWLDLRELALPLYDGDLEEANGLPEGAKKLKAVMRASDGFLISSPEYNGSVPGVLKNAIDWASRTETDDEPDLVAFHGKVVALVSASPGGFGGMRSLQVLRLSLSHIGVMVLPSQLSVSKAHQAFTEEGTLKGAHYLKQLEKIAKELVAVAGKMRG
jgi:NAD(P)H-dependent FMN reductase